MEGKDFKSQAAAPCPKCDNVILEYALALDLHDLKDAAIMPLFVGNKDSAGKYSHFFESGCMPRGCKDVIVESIATKVFDYLESNAVC